MAIFYSLLSGLALISAIFVIRSLNPVFSLLFLILTFVSCSGVLILVGLDFYAMIFLIVYVGAIAVLFLFVIMMLNINLTVETSVRYIPVSGLIGIILMLEVNYLIVSKGLDGKESIVYKDWLKSLESETVIEAIGQHLYTYSIFSFLLAGLILLVSMIGSIMLTLQKNPLVRRQEVYEQNAREFSKTVVKYREIK